MGNKTKVNEEDIRIRYLQTKVSDNEDERIGWAAKELGLTKSSFIRMAALRLAKETIS